MSVPLLPFRVYLFEISLSIHTLLENHPLHLGLQVYWPALSKPFSGSFIYYLKNFFLLFFCFFVFFSLFWWWHFCLGTHPFKDPCHWLRSLSVFSFCFQSLFSLDPRLASSVSWRCWHQHKLPLFSPPASERWLCGGDPEGWLSCRHENRFCVSLYVKCTGHTQTSSLCTICFVLVFNFFEFF